MAAPNTPARMRMFFKLPLLSATTDFVGAVLSVFWGSGHMVIEMAVCVELKREL